jgi:hypothetical protein
VQRKVAERRRKRGGGTITWGRQVCNRLGVKRGAKLPLAGPVVDPLAVLIEMIPNVLIGLAAIRVILEGFREIEQLCGSGAVPCKISSGAAAIEGCGVLRFPTSFLKRGM